jgi:hypothetical protein
MEFLIIPLWWHGEGGVRQNCEQVTMSESNDQSLIPPGPKRVAQRALVLSAVVCRGSIEGDAGSKDAERFREEILDWVYDLSLSDEIESDELELLTSPLGTLPKQRAIDAGWRGEGLAILAWALKKIDLPAHDQIVDSPTIAYSLGFLKDENSTVLQNPQLRTAKECNQLAEAMFSFHWRLRQYSMDQAAMNFIEFARDCWFGPLELNGLRCIEDDLAIGDNPISKAPNEAWRKCLSIGQERHQAANWLKGVEKIYSEVTTDT